MKDTIMQGNKRRASHHSSVWIDPALSSYFIAEPGERDAAVLEQPGDHHERRALADSARRNPTTPIPQRASALPPGSITVRPRYSRSFLAPAQEDDVARMKTLSPAMWEYESQDFQAGSSLSSLSLVDTSTLPNTQSRKSPREVDIDEVATLPSPLSPRKPVVVESAHVPQQHVVTIDEIDTIPPLSASHTIDVNTLDTLPPRAERPVPMNALVVAPRRMPAQPAARMSRAASSPSWTAGGAAQSPFARRIVERKGGKGFAWNGSAGSSYGRSPFRHPLDRLRWWLLRPKHIEYVLWIGGAFLLMLITAALVLAAAINLFWAMPGQPFTTQQIQTTGAPASGSTSQQGSATPLLTLNANEPLVAGQPLRLSGRGFTPNATIILTHDMGQPCQPPSVQANGQGAFTVTLDDSTWGAGLHRLFAQDSLSHRTLPITITLAAGPIGKHTTATPGAGTPTPGGVQSTPVYTSPTPIPTVKPTVTSTPSPVPTQTTPTPGITPTVSPATTATPGASSPSTAALDLAGQHVSIVPGGSWLWLLAMLGGSTALLMLAVAGLLVSRRRV